MSVVASNSVTCSDRGFKLLPLRFFCSFLEKLDLHHAHAHSRPRRSPRRPFLILLLRLYKPIDISAVMVTKPRSKRATSSQRKAGASHDFDAGGSDEDEKPKQAKPKAKPNADAKPRGKPPKGAKSNQPHSSQRESSRKSDSDSEKEGDDSDSEKEGDDVKMHDSDADADSKAYANADAKAGAKQIDESEGTY